MLKAALRLVTLSLAVGATAGPALAHHAMGGDTPTTWLEGLVTGLAHPAIGLDHLAFTVAVGLLAAIAGASLYAPLLFVAGTLAGCLLFLGGVGLPVTEWLILASVLGLGLALAAGHRQLRPLELGLFSFAGLFHGMAYAEGIIGAEAAPLMAYLLGFSAIQFAIAAGVMLLVRALWRGEQAALPTRLGGALVAGIGVAYAFESIESLLLPALA